MFKTVLMAVCLAVCSSGCVEAPAKKPVTDTQAQAAKAQAQKPDCIHSTGTRITLKQNQCAAVSGRVYTQEDLNRTGQISPAAALRQLDPAF